MHLRIFTLLIASFFVVSVRADDSAKPDPDRRLNEVKSLVEEYRDAMQAGKKINPNGFVPRVMKLVEADPKDDVSFQLLGFSLMALKSDNPVIPQTLIDHHLENRRIAGMCMALSQMPSAGAKKVAGAVYRKHPDDATRAVGLYSLAQMSYRMWEEGEPQDPKLKAEAVELFQKVIKEFPGTDKTRAELTKLSKSSLFEIENLSIGCTAPEIKSQSLTGERVKLSDYRGKVVVLDIWATWCGPCKAMIPQEREMVKSLEGRPFALISISADDDKETVVRFQKQTEMPWTHWWNGPEGGILDDWNISSFPTIYVLDAKGVIRFKGVRGAHMSDAVEKLLAELK